MGETLGRVDGPTILLSSGRYFDVDDPLNPPPTITDIAYGLAYRSRWSGQAIYRETGRHVYYSIAQHCVEFANRCLDGQRFAYCALMHEAGEFVWGDLGGPLKVRVPDFKLAEKTTEAFLLYYFEAVPTDYSMKVQMKEMDQRWMATERRDFMNWNETDFWSYIGNAKPYDEKIIPVSPDQAAEDFLALFYKLAPSHIRERELA